MNLASLRAKLSAVLSGAGYPRFPVEVEQAFNAIRVEFDAYRRVPADVVESICVLIDVAEKRGGNVPWDTLHDVFDTVLLHATGRHRGLSEDGTFRPLDREIARVKMAIQRRQKKLDAMATRHQPLTGHCCPSCALGGAYTKPMAKQERATQWLCVLLSKRNEVGDASFVERIQTGRWP